MKISYIRSKPDGSIFKQNFYRWWSGSKVFQDANTPADDHDWHIFGQADTKRTISQSPYGRFKRCIFHFFESKIVGNFRLHGMLNGPTRTPNDWDFVVETPLIRNFVDTLKREWPEILDGKAPNQSGAWDYMECVILENLELVEIDLDTGVTTAKTMIEYSTKKIQSRYKKLMYSRSAGQPVHN